MNARGMRTNMLLLIASILLSLLIVSLWFQLALAQEIPPSQPVTPTGTVTPVDSLEPSHPLYPKPMPQNTYVEYLPLIVID